MNDIEYAIDELISNEGDCNLNCRDCPLTLLCDTIIGSGAIKLSDALLLRLAHKIKVNDNVIDIPYLLFDELL